MQENVAGRRVTAENAINTATSLFRSCKRTSINKIVANPAAGVAKIDLCAIPQAKQKGLARFIMPASKDTLGCPPAPGAVPGGGGGGVDQEAAFEERAL